MELGGFARGVDPSGVAVDSLNNVYVADTGNDRVVAFIYPPILTPRDTDFTGVAIVVAVIVVVVLSSSTSLYCWYRRSEVHSPATHVETLSAPLI